MLAITSSLSTKNVRGDDRAWTHKLEELARKGTPLTPRQRFEIGAAYLETQPARAKQWLAEPAGLGYAWAQYYLGKIECKLQSFEACAHWMSQAGAQGFTDAGIDLYLLYFEGRGVPKDLKRACIWGFASGHLDPEDLQPCRSELSANDFSDVRKAAREMRARKFQDFE